jgi:hypothetical protein
MNALITTLGILNAIKAVVVALPISADVPAVKMFETVQFFTEPDLVAALAQLRIVQNRVCLIIPSADRYEPTRAGREIRIEALREVTFLFADRHFGQPNLGSIGDDQRPGVLTMKDTLEEMLIGNNLGLKPRLLRMHPLHGEALNIALEQSQQRKAWLMSWEVSAGWKAVQEF